MTSKNCSAFICAFEIELDWIYRQRFDSFRKDDTKFEVFKILAVALDGLKLIVEQKHASRHTEPILHEELNCLGSPRVVEIVLG
jgi:hypothetical protein